MSILSKDQRVVLKCETKVSCVESFFKLHNMILISIYMYNGFLDKLYFSSSN